MTLSIALIALGLVAIRPDAQRAGGPGSSPAPSSTSDASRGRHLVQAFPAPCERAARTCAVHRRDWRATTDAQGRFQSSDSRWGTWLASECRRHPTTRRNRHACMWRPSIPGHRLPGGASVSAVADESLLSSCNPLRSGRALGSAVTRQDMAAGMPSRFPRFGGEGSKPPPVWSRNGTFETPSFGRAGIN